MISKFVVINLKIIENKNYNMSSEIHKYIETSLEKKQIYLTHQ